MIVNLIGAYIQAEVATCDLSGVALAKREGRIDAVIETRTHVYIFEFKLDQSCAYARKATAHTVAKTMPGRSIAEKALEQIKDMRYYQKYLHARKQIILVGANFSFAKRNIDKWISEELA